MAGCVKVEARLFIIAAAMTGLFVYGGVFFFLGAVHEERILVYSAMDWLPATLRAIRAKVQIAGLRISSGERFSR
jgi:hypothetical protein